MFKVIACRTIACLSLFLTQSLDIVYTKEYTTAFASQTEQIVAIGRNPVPIYSVWQLIKKLRVQRRPSVKNLRLQGTMGQLFRNRDRIPGGTAGSIIYEKLRGRKLSPAGHIEKGTQRTRELRNILRDEPLGADDRKIAQNVLKDLESALNIKP